jgi:hypothetical protein
LEAILASEISDIFRTVRCYSPEDFLLTIIAMRFSNPTPEYLICKWGWARLGVVLNTPPKKANKLRGL